jgi:hypothetical protein
VLFNRASGFRRTLFYGLKSVANTATTCRFLHGKVFRGAENLSEIAFLSAGSVGSCQLRQEATAMQDRHPTPIHLTILGLHLWIERKFFLRDAGRKLKHLDQEIHSGHAELSENITARFGEDEARDDRSA